MRAAACMHACTCPGAEWSDDSGFIYSALIVSYDCLAGGGGTRITSSNNDGSGHLIRERAQVSFAEGKRARCSQHRGPLQRWQG